MKTPLPKLLTLTVCVAALIQATSSAPLSPRSEALMRGFPADLASTSASDAILERNDDIPIVSRSIQSAEENTLSRNLSEEVDDLSDEVDGLQDGQGDSLDLEDEDDDSPDLRSRKHHKGKAKHKSHKSGKSHKKAAVHTSLKKGLLTGKGTFFKPGMGACGWKSDSNDMIAAISHLKWDGGSHCGKSATVCRGSRCIQVTMADMCPSCAVGSLDLSPAAFKGLGSLDLGVVPITWHFD